MRALRIALCAALVALLLALPTMPARACSCAEATAAAHLQAASTVFVGVAADTGEGADGLVASFRVERVYKGASQDRAEVKTPRDGAACGVPFVSGRSYAVFAHDQAGTLTTTLCSGTTDDLSSLSGITPIGGATAPVRAPEAGNVGRTRTGPIAIAALLIGLLAAASALAVRAARRPRPIA